MKIVARASAVLAVVASVSQPVAAQPVEGAAGPYVPASQCATCHETIHQYWSESAHSRSATSPAFQAALKATIAAAADPAAARRACVWCHAPTTLVTADWGLEHEATRDGVSCDFCHTVADVDLSRKDNPFDAQPGPVKRGPLEYAASPFHETAYSVLHKSSPLLCAGCHEYRNGHGVAVLSTYSEWKDGPYPDRGMPCQECHMPLVPGHTVREGLASAQRVINLHRLVGGSAASKVESGMELEIASAQIGGASASVEVVVTNTGVGHSAPSGLSTKALVLAVGVDTGSGELSGRKERVYRRDLKDADGKSLTDVASLFRDAASVGEDTRIAPKQSRTERFTMPLPEGWKAIVARLEYRDSTDPDAPRTSLVLEARRER